jgi:hypothetical protein
MVKEKSLAHLDLDTLAWLPENPPKRAPSIHAKEKIDEFIKTNDCWVIEGCYTDLLELVAPVAKEAIFMNLNIDQCIENAKNRPWEPHKYESKEAQDSNLSMLINWIKQYTERKDEFSFDSHMGFYENFTGRKTMYTSNDKNT